jgi:hypothetical protein
MREPANKRMLTDVSGLRSYRCTIIKLTNPSEFREGAENVAFRLDKGHKRMRSLILGACLFSANALS